MSDRSGLGLVELAILEVLDTLTAGRPRATPASSRVIAGVEERIGLGPRYSYDVLVDLARRWTIPVRLVSFRGNYGDADFPAAEPQYTSCRLSDAGSAALDAEAGRIGPVPIGLINGSIYCGGTRPPLDPLRVISALRHLLESPRMTDSDIVKAVGPPDFLTGCVVSGDFDALASGRRTVLRLTSRIEIAGDQQLVITDLPPAASAFDVARALSDRQAPPPWAQSHPRLSEETTLPITDVDQPGMEGLTDDEVIDDESITVTLAPGADAEAVRSALLEIDGITQQVPAAFPAPLATMLRSCLDRDGAQSLALSLDRLEEAIRADRRRELRHL